MNHNHTESISHLFVFLEIFSQEGGIQSYIKELLKAYISAGLGRAEVFLLRDGSNCGNPFEGEGSPLKFYYLKTSPPWLGRLRIASALFQSLQKHRPQRIFCGHVKLAPLVNLLCQFFKVPYTVLTYGKEVWEPLSPLYRKALQEAESIWTIGRYTRERACISNNLNPQKFQLLPCAVDGTVFTPGPKPPALINRYNLAGAKVLMTVARLWSGDIYKGVDVTIRALPYIAQKIPNVKYLVIGRGNDRPRLQKLAADLKVAERVVFAGFVPKEELPEHYRVADAYIMPSQEGFGIVYLEAMACGIPVLAGDNDGSAEPLEDGRLGWRVPHRDVNAVAAACVEILQGEDQRCDGAWLRQEVLKRFGTDSFTERLKQLVCHNF